VKSVKSVVRNAFLSEILNNFLLFLLRRGRDVV